MIPHAGHIALRVTGKGKPAVDGNVPCPGGHFIILLLLLFNGSVSAQQHGGTEKSGKDGQSIYDVFHTEMDRYIPSTSDLQKKKPLKSALPEGWNQVPSGIPDSVFAPGISDPGLPEKMAVVQAIIRAAGLASLSSGCRSAYISDFYSSAKSHESDSKFEEMCSFRSAIPVDISRVRIIRSFRLRSGEVMVLAAFPAGDIGGSGSPVFQEGYLYNYDVDANGSRTLVRKYNSTAYQPDGNTQVQQADSLSFYRLNLRFTNIRSLRNMTGNKARAYDYYYSPPRKEPLPADSHGTPADCRSGLWVALIDRIFEQLGGYVKKTAGRNQVVQDQSGETRNELHREKTLVGMTFSIDDISLINNSLKVEITIRHEESN